MDTGLEQKLTEHERRISKLEQQRENDYAKINEHNINLATIVIKLENITGQLAVLTSNWKETMSQNNKQQQEVHNNINKRIEHLEKNYEILENELTDKTVGKNSETYEKIKWAIVSIIITAIVSFLINKLL